MTGNTMSDKTSKLPKLPLQFGAPDKALPLLALLLALLGAWLLWSGVRQWRAEAADSALMAERDALAQKTAQAVSQVRKRAVDAAADPAVKTAAAGTDLDAVHEVATTPAHHE